ncbi:hypothetical protein DVB88_02820, partial [Tsukamurella pulmonis]
VAGADQAGPAGAVVGAASQFPSLGAAIGELIATVGASPFDVPGLPRIVGPTAELLGRTIGGGIGGAANLAIGSIGGLIGVTLAKAA